MLLAAEERRKNSLQVQPWQFGHRHDAGDGRFIWPQAESGSVALSSAQLAMLLEGIDWRRPERTWQPSARSDRSHAVDRKPGCEGRSPLAKSAV
jgi:transposase